MAVSLWWIYADVLWLCFLFFKVEQQIDGVTVSLHNDCFPMLSGLLKSIPGRPWVLALFVRVAICMRPLRGLCAIQLVSRHGWDRAGWNCSRSLRLLAKVWSPWKRIGKASVLGILVTSIWSSCQPGTQNRLGLVVESVVLASPL